MLTEQQVNHFETFGMLLLRQLFSPAEMEEITAEAEAVWREDLVSQPEGQGHQHVVPFLEKRPLLARLPEDDRIYLPIQQLLGPGFVWGGSEGNKGSFNETRDHQWHSDRAGQIALQYTRIKIMIYLQAMTKDTGALRVIPGSHHAAFHQELLRLQPQQQQTSRAAFGVGGPELCCHPLEVEPGDIVLFNHYLFHAVYGKQEERSYVAMKFAAEPVTETQIEALRAHGQDASALDGAFRHSQRPRIRGMVDKLLEWERELGVAAPG